MKLKKLAAAVVVSASLSLTSPQASADGIPTLDLTAIAHMVDQLNQMKAQYAMLESQYKQLQAMTEKLEGYSGTGEDIMMNVLEQVFPEIADVISDLENGQYPDRIDEIFKEKGFDKACTINGFAGPDKSLCEQHYKTIAATRYLFEESAKNANKQSLELTRLADEVKNAKSVKDVADLQIRISEKQGQIQLAQFKADQLARQIEAEREARAERVGNQLRDELFRSYRNTN